tara:strand:+ start:24958 stop:25866 length:909 start_codon:yes stop_codon:yes gene_type:complete
MFDCYKKEWNNIEKVETYPHHLRNIVIIDADEFVDKIYDSTPEEAKKIVESIYAGDAYILKTKFDNKFVKNLKENVFQWSVKNKPCYYEMRNGCPNYHSLNNQKRGPQDGYETIEHSYVFFRWNGDTLKIFEPFEKYWEAIKVLSGNQPESFKKNIPTDGIIDRITFLQYPIGYGHISKHYDSPKKQKLLLGCVLTQIGKDYDYGENGFYLVDKNDKKIYLENLIDAGDFICAYPAMYHGVPKVTKKNFKGQSSWDSTVGRWYMQLYSPESHEVENREYTTAIKDCAGHGPIANHIKEEIND